MKRRTPTTAIRVLALVSGFSLVAMSAAVGGSLTLGGESRAGAAEVPAVPGAPGEEKPEAGGPEAEGPEPWQGHEFTAEEQEAIDRASWAVTTWSAPIEFYEEFPLRFKMGFPVTETRLDTPTPACEVRTANVWFGYIIEETVIPGHMPGGTTSPDDPKSTYRNPTRAHAGNPPFTSTYSHAGVKEVNAPAGEDAGPYAYAECPTPLKALGEVKAANMKVGDISVGQHRSTTDSHFVASKRTIETLSEQWMQDIVTPAARFESLGGMLKVDIAENGAPVVSYRFRIAGASDANGKPIWLGSNGLDLAGQNVPVHELTNQFNEQLKANEEAVAALGKHDIVIMGTKEYRDDYDRYVVEGPTIDLGYHPAARQGASGQYQALRLGASMFTGIYFTPDQAPGFGGS
jgi:hypothetical protein